VNAGRKCGADLLWICTRGRIHAENPLRGFMLKIDCGSVAGLPRNLRIWMRGGLYAQLDCGSVAGLPRNLQIWTLGGLYAEDSLRIWTRGGLYAEDRLQIRCGADSMLR